MVPMERWPEPEVLLVDQGLDLARVPSVTSSSALEMLLLEKLGCRRCSPLQAGVGGEMLVQAGRLSSGFIGEREVYGGQGWL